MAACSPAQLLDLNAEDFAAIVDLDLRNNLDQVILEALSSPEVVHRWRSRLEQMSVQSTLIGDAKDAEAEAERLEQALANKTGLAEETRVKNLRRRASALRFQAILKHRTIHVEWLIATYLRAVNNQASRLAEAIVEHRNTTAEPGPADRQLWQVLEDIQIRSAVRPR